LSSYKGFVAANARALFLMIGCVALLNYQALQCFIIFLKRGINTPKHNDGKITQISVFGVFSI
jgi:hypothetical protein